jgi:hypothetical protein
MIRKMIRKSITASPVHSLPIGELYLLRARRLDPRPAAFLDPSAYPDAPPASVFGSRPAAVKLRVFRFRIVTVKSLLHRRPKFT